MENNRYIVTWDNVDQSFMYGTMIKKEDGLHFVNYQTPTGIQIHKWEMTTDFYADKAIPDLPFLHRGKRYTFKFNYEAQPLTGIYFKMTFFRRNETIIKTEIIQEKTIDLIVPAECYSYQIEMMSSSIQSLHFQSIEIIGDEIMDVAPSVNIVNRYLQLEGDEGQYERNY